MVAVAAVLLAQAFAAAEPLWVQIAPLAADVLNSAPRAGLAVGVWHEGKARVFGFGSVTTPVGTRAPDARTLFEVGSVTKVFTGTLLADAEARGELKLADPVNAHLPPDLRLPGANGAKATLADLATHRSGLPRMPGGLVSALLANDAENPYADLTRARLAAFVREVKVGEPGKNENYSNFGAGVAGHALVRASKLADFDALVRERLAKPLKLADTAEALTGEQRSRLAVGFAKGEVTPHWDFATLPGCGALRSTADDLLTFARAQWGEGDAVAVAACRAAQAKRAGDLGLFWNHTRLPDTKTAAIWHNGGTFGSRSMLVVVPSRKLAVVALCSSGDPGRAVDLLPLKVANRLARPVADNPQASTPKATPPPAPPRPR